MTAIAPGVPCFLVGLTNCPELNGRVVEVVGLVPTPDGECGVWYRHESSWAREMFGGLDTIAPRCNLLPITPPEFAPPAARKRIPETVSR